MKATDLARLTPKVARQITSPSLGTSRQDGIFKQLGGFVGNAPGAASRIARLTWTEVRNRRQSILFRH